MADAILGSFSTSSKNVLQWECFATSSNTTEVLFNKIPSTSINYIMIYAVCTLNTIYTINNTSTKAHVCLYGSNPSLINWVFATADGYQNSLPISSYISPLGIRCMTENHTYFKMAEYNYAVDSSNFFGIMLEKYGNSPAEGTVGQVSSIFYGIKEFS